MKSFKFVVLCKNAEESVFYKTFENADMAKKYASTLIKENIDRIQVFSVFRKDEKYGELLNCVCQYSSNTLR